MQDLTHGQVVLKGLQGQACGPEPSTDGENKSGYLLSGPWCCRDLKVIPYMPLTSDRFFLRLLGDLDLAHPGDGSFFTAGSARNLVTMERVPLGTGKREFSR